MHCRLRGGGNGSRLSGQEKGPRALLSLFRSLLGGHALCDGSSSVCPMAADRRSGHRRGLGDLSKLHRRDCSHQSSRPLRDASTSLGIVVGILAAVFVNMLIQRMGDEAWNISTGWRWMFFAGVVPAILFGMMILPAVESPRWLMKMGRRDQALNVLSKINGAEVGRQEAAEIEISLATEEGHISELFTTFRRPLLLGIMLAGCNRSAESRPYSLSCRRFFAPPERRRATHFFSPCWSASSIFRLPSSPSGWWTAPDARR
jgi:hypothetical protein